MTKQEKYESRVFQLEFEDKCNGKIFMIWKRFGWQFYNNIMFCPKNIFKFMKKSYD